MSDETLAAAQAQFEGVESCKCDVGFLCERGCDLPYLECVQKHYYHHCGHSFKDWYNTSDGGTLICQHCGVSAIQHDMATGP